LCYSRLAALSPPTAEPSPLSLHDALPILNQLIEDREPVLDGRAEVGDLLAEGVEQRSARLEHLGQQRSQRRDDRRAEPGERGAEDRKSTRLNSSHVKISYAVFCLTKKMQT